MSDIKQVFREEISRLARKELKSSLLPLTKQIAQLKKALAEQKKQIMALEKSLGCTSVKTKYVSGAADLHPQTRKLAKPRVGATQIQKLRKRLRLSQSEMALLLGVNINSVALWEQGKVVPRLDAKQRIAALRAIPRHNVRKVVAEMLAEAAKSKKADK